jgi:dTDP-4-dehydrorhamnose 3,5-epimerase
MKLTLLQVISMRRQLLRNVKGYSLMTKFKKLETGIEGLVVIEPKVFEDPRGFFMEAYNKKEFDAMGLSMNFVQDNHSKSMKGVLRGLHFQTEHPQGKLVRATKGSVWDVAVDIRETSITYGQWYGVLLSEENKKMLYIPKEFAHGFITLEDETEFMYKCTDFYYPEYDAGIKYDDNQIGIEWPLDTYGIKAEEILLSDKDRNLPTLKEYTETKERGR